MSSDIKVLMLGWEYPPNISGGLGTACEGLTKGLSRAGVEVTFVVPQLLGGENASHMRLVDSADQAEIVGLRRKAKTGVVRKHRVTAALSPYWSPDDYQDYVKVVSEWKAGKEDSTCCFDDEDFLGKRKGKKEKGPSEIYGTNLFEEVSRFTGNVLSLAADEEFDVIHVHDWMTYPAGVALAEVTGKPLIVHVHSLESDRSGAHAHPRILEMERLGLEAATVIVAVSHYTRCMVNKTYGIPLDRIEVVHNGMYRRKVVEHYRTKWNSASKIVLFLGRITYQKGPEYFVEVAPRVIPHVPDVLFVMAGTGDLLPRLVNRVNELGVAEYFHFTGFLREKEVEQMFSVADLYVMPSVSEPFGLTALEAINFNTPAIISKQSGVAEVLTHALKFDFWDIDRLGDLIINGLLHDELREDMVRMAQQDLAKLHWDASAQRTLEVYNSVMHG